MRYSQGYINPSIGLGKDATQQHEKILVKNFYSHYIHLKRESDKYYMQAELMHPYRVWFGPCSATLNLTTINFTLCKQSINQCVICFIDSNGMRRYVQTVQGMFKNSSIHNATIYSFESEFVCLYSNTKAHKMLIFY